MAQKAKQTRIIGGTLRQLRLQRNMTQEQVVIQLQLQGIDMSRSAYSQIECGTYNIRISELDALVELFQTDYNFIFKK